MNYRTNDDECVYRENTREVEHDDKLWVIETGSQPDAITTACTRHVGPMLEDHVNCHYVYLLPTEPIDAPATLIPASHAERMNSERYWAGVNQ